MKNHKAKEVFKVKNKIYKIAKAADEVEVQIDKTEKGEYESLIRVHIPPRKNIIAIKKSDSLKSSLEKSTQAAIKQVQRIKNKNKKSSNFCRKSPCI